MARKLATHRDEVEQDPDEIRKMKRKVFQSESQDVALTKTQLKKRKQQLPNLLDYDTMG